MIQRGQSHFKWSYGAIPLARNETHERVIGFLEKEHRGSVLDVPTGTGVFADRLRKLGFAVSCCDINPSYFSVPELKIDMGDLNQSLPYPDGSFDYIICIDGIEHTENPSNAIREFQRMLRKGGKLFLSAPNYLNIERRFRYLFMGSLSKIPSHKTIQEVWKGDLSMAHLSPLGYPLLKFIMEHFGFRILRVEKEKRKLKMNLFLPMVWIIRLYGRFVSEKSRQAYQLNETLRKEIIMGGNTLILIGEKIF